MASNNTFGIHLTGGQLRAARALLKMDQRSLADLSNVSIATIKRVEPQSGPIKANRVTLLALRQALENAGIEFIPENGGGVGVRLSKRSTQP